mmetsp:Transcript_3060/g.7649  ORF Transcript_3060/g.7649 Transcript_3060/m.7649 type:complete len:80 (+) Transcript_3060:186-425(+)
MVLLTYGYGLNSRRYFWIFLIILFSIMALSSSSTTALAFLTVALLFFFALIADFMFGDTTGFKYDPNYNNWIRQTSTFN